MTMMIRGESVKIRNNLYLWLIVVLRMGLNRQFKTLCEKRFHSIQIFSPRNARIYCRSWLAARCFDNKGRRRRSGLRCFQILNRIGYTTHHCDWPPRQRKGLASYDIGENHNAKLISSGTWHSKVGRGHSASSERYLFDLSLLARVWILEEYGHDPHTHYYLGLTHEAYASNYYLDSNIGNEITSEVFRKVYPLPNFAYYKYICTRIWRRETGTGLEIYTSTRYSNWLTYSLS